eukprot:TRINITY_DN2125_c0_g5_i1.p1 TRINITY_DN2125_c0_g5~~TRINITY_DN2125_c0_g5_i1.p1  ORF type:complete len:554 (+),score=71.09 TRINITY_DN2125_c0_g5_i1:454-2115(+)
MKGDRILLCLLHLFYFLATACCTHRHKEDIALCLTSHGLTNFTAPHSPHYNHFLYASLSNLVFSRPTFLRPTIIILPHNLDQLTAAIRCSTQSSLTIRLRSGGHSYEGLSSTAPTPFAIIDLMNLDRVIVDLKTNTAWAESGATLGMIYQAVAVAAPNLGFPAGFCATVGSGGHFSGGGYGMLARMYGLAADNVIDAVLVDARGQVLDRAGMGEDVFWAIRGGGGGSWGAVYSWKIQLQPVPKTVTSFTVIRNGTSTNIAKLLHKWQFVAPKLEDEFYLTVSVVVPESANQLSAEFQGFYAGPWRRTQATLTRVFPELSLEEDQCNESSWIEAVFYFSNGKSLLDRFDDPLRGFFKIKGDIVREPIPLEGLKGAMERLVKMPKGAFGCIPNGGIMHRIKTNAIPYPHRANNLFEVNYYVGWSEEEDGESDTYIDWIRGLHGYMTPFVSKDPRASEVNELDLDYGVMNWENVSVCDAWKVAKSWGERYFMGNYERLVRAKTLIDPNNVFRHPQSIPPLPKSCGVPAFPGPLYDEMKGRLQNGPKPLADFKTGQN